MLDEEIARLERARVVLAGEPEAVIKAKLAASIPKAQEFREGPNGKLVAVAKRTPRAPGERGPGRPPKSDGPSCAERIATHLSQSSCQSVDALVAATGAPIGTVRATLSRMMTDGKVKSEGTRADRRWSLREEIAAE